MKNEQKPKDKFLPLRDEAAALVHPAAAERDSDETDPMTVTG